MKFQDIMNMLSDRVKEQVAQEHQKTDLQLQFLIDPEYLHTCWESMSTDEKQVIDFFIKVKGEDFLTYRELEQSKLPLHPVRFRLAMTRLQRLGVIFTLRRMWGELAYIMPCEMVNHFRKIRAPESPLWRTQPLPLDHTSYHIIDDLLQVLNVVNRKSLELTKKGTLPKKTLKSLFEHTKVNKELFAEFPCVPSVLSPYDLHEAILLDLLVQAGLLVKKGNEIVLGDVEKWIHQPLESVSIQLMKQLIGYLDINPKLTYFYALIQDLDKGQGYSLNSILHSMQEFAPLMGEVRDKLITPLSGFGFIQYQGMPEDLVFMWKNQGEIPQALLYIQPNFEILVPGFAPRSLKWQLLSFASLIKKEEMWVFRLDKNAAQGYFEKGKSAEDLISFLQTVSQAPIPENVEEAIGQWEKQFQQVSFLDARIMKISHSEMARELERIPSISQYFQERLGERAYVIHVKDWDLLVIELEKRGYITGAVHNLLHTNAEEESHHIHFMKPQPSGGDYKVESVFPELEDAIPELRQIPRMWISHYSRYHESTLREMVQWAIQSGMEVKLEWKGRECTIQPHGLVNRHGFWTLLSEGMDKKEMAFRLEEIGKIRILVPFQTGKY